MHEEQDTCRICSAPAEPDQPLFHPCKCSGTIRYIHQECLTTWLTHSKKQHCDVCKHPYSFTKVYATDMPQRLPILLVLRKLVQQFFSILVFSIRAILVACIWLAVLPWITLWTWRAYFAVGDITAFWIADVPRPPVPQDKDEPAHEFNVTLFSNLSDPNTSLISVISSHPVWKSLAADIFLGQIIASLIVLTFVAVFLLREWVSQNARPGVFEDADVPPVVDDPLPEANADQPHEPHPADPAPPPIAPRPETPPPPMEPIPFPAFVQEPRRRAIIRRRGGRLHEIHANGDHDRANETDDVPDEEGNPRYSVRFRRRLSRIDSSSDSGEEDPKPEVTSSPIYSNSNSTLKEAHEEAKRRKETVAQADKPPLLTDHEEAKSTLTASLTADSQSWTELLSASSLDTPPPDPNLRASSPISIPPTSTFGRRAVPNDAAPPRPSSLPSTPKSQFESPGSHSQESFFPSTTPSSTLPTTGPPLPYPLIPRRPPMPSTTIPSPQAIALSSPGAGPSNGKRRSGSAPVSPGLASYIAPEELEVTSVKSYQDYFDLPVDVGEGPSGVGSGGVDKETNDAAYEGMKELPKDEWGDYVEDDDTDTDLSDLGEGTSIAGLLDLVARQAGNKDVIQPLEPVPERQEGAVAKEPEDDFDPRDFPTYFGDGTLDLMEGRDHNSDNLLFTDSDDDDDDAQDLGHLEHILRDGAPVGLRIREVRPGAVENLAGVGGAIGQQNGLGNGVANPPGNDQVDPVAPVQEVNEEMEPNLEDDMEGAMEAIGLRGPVLTVLQNAALMVLILDTTIGFSILLPFTLGKSTALLTLNPRRTIQLAHLPIRAIRFVTDPIVDMVGLVLQIILIGPFLRTCQRFVDTGFFRLIIGEGRVKGVTDALTSTYQHGLDFASAAHGRFGEIVSAFESGGATGSDMSSNSLLDRGLDSTLGRLVEPYFASFGQEVRSTAEGVGNWWVHMSLGRGPVEKAFAIVYGYLLVGVSLAIYMNILTVGTIKTAEKAVRTVVRQQLLVVKVATFIIIELIVFPLGCGVILDLCTIWFFPEVSLRARLVFMQYAPLTATFYHWVVGTMFMYMFAILLGGCRQIMRSGAMWFIKDPQNQNMHPIRDILERPTFTHLYKLFQSAIMYALVVVCGVGNVSFVVQTFTPSLLPFRWKPREPLSTVPYDLVFMHLILPYTIHYFRPRTAARQVGTLLWKWLSRKLRVSSYMFGERHTTEEAVPKGFFGFRPKNGARLEAPQPRREGGWRRVPANDNVAIVRSMRATVEVTEDGQPINDVEARLLKLQNAEAERHKRNVDEDYTVVYIPPYFKYRIIAFILAVWSVCCIAIAAMLAGPVLLGRRFFLLFTAREVHDGYSFVVGFHLLWGCWLVAQAIERLDRHRQRRENGSRAWWPLFLAKRSSLWLAQASYMAFFLVFVIPTLIALVMETYVLLPIKFVYDPRVVVRVKLVDMWVLGLFYTKIILRLPGFEAPRRMNEGIQRINRNGWSRPDPMTATKEVIGPAVGGLLTMLSLPVGLLWVFKMLFKTLVDHQITDRSLFTSIYPGIFMGVGIARGIWGAQKVYLKWSQSVRDKEFLVEMRLRNLEPEENKEKVVEKKVEEGEEEAAVRDLPVLDLIENQSDGESDNEDERFLL